MMPSFFEIDPRLTRDSVIVLMHDVTIDRTTNGTGRVADYTLAELQQFRLKDRDGNLTEFRIPTLEEAIRWSQGKTILNLDIKGCPAGVHVAVYQPVGSGQCHVYGPQCPAGAAVARPGSRCHVLGLV